MSNLVFCDDCDTLVDTEVVDGEVRLSCGCDPDSYLQEEDCQPLNFDTEPSREYESDTNGGEIHDSEEGSTSPFEQCVLS